MGVPFVKVYTKQIERSYKSHAHNIGERWNRTEEKNVFRQTKATIKRHEHKLIETKKKLLGN